MKHPRMWRSLPLMAALSTVQAHACTVCDSSTGQQLRAGLLNGHLGSTLLRVLLPFPVFAAIVAGVHCALTAWSRSGGELS